MFIITTQQINKCHKIKIANNVQENKPSKK